jgi:hypothetical protein
MTMVALDRKTVMFALIDQVPEQTSPTSQIVERPALGDSSKILVQRLWERGEDYRILKD